MTPEAYADFLRHSFDAYLRTSSEAACEPLRDYLPYDAVNLDGVKWRSMGQLIIEDELREITNKLNGWLSALKRWCAWQMVTGSLNEDEKWCAEHEFVTPIATYCLFQPSSVRDALTFVITNGVHQVLLALDSNYKDRLPLDQDPWGRPTHPTRRKKEDQLSKLLSRFVAQGDIIGNIRRLDDELVKGATADFRNRASHSIAPRFTIGVTQTVTRSIVKATRLEKQAGEKFHEVLVSGQSAVSYGVGGTGPLDLNEVRKVNVTQFEIAVSCFSKYLEFLHTVVGNGPSLLGMIGKGTGSGAQ